MYIINVVQAPPHALYTGTRHATRLQSKERNATAMQDKCKTEAETTSQKQEGGERDGYRSMHYILHTRYAASTTGQRPTIVDAINKAGRVTLRHTGVRPLYADMAMRAVADARDVPEFLGVARDNPRLSERNAPGACGLADQPVCAAIEAVRGTAPTPKAGLHLTLAPVCTRPRPL